MALVLNNIVELRIFCTFNQQASVNVRHYRAKTVAGQGPSLKVMADELSPGIAAWYKPLLNNLAKYNGCGMRIIFPLPISVESFSAIGNGPGLSAGLPLPGQDSGLISLRTQLGGRRNRGRVYVPFPSQGDSTAVGAPTAGYVDNLNDLADFLIQDQNLGVAPDTCTLAPVIWHRDQKGYTDVIARLTQDKWATQRRRGLFGRSNESPI